MGPASLAIGGLGLAGNIYGRWEQERQRKKLLAQIMAMMDPGKLEGETNSLFDMLKRSPMYTGMRSDALTSASQLGNRMQTGYARAGLNTTGIAQMGTTAARSSFQQNFNNIDMSMFAKALSAAMGNRDARIGALEKYGLGSNPVAGGIGQSLSDWGPMLREWAKNSKWGQRSRAPSLENLWSQVGQGGGSDYEMPQQRGGGGW